MQSTFKAYKLIEGVFAMKMKEKSFTKSNQGIISSSKFYRLKLFSALLILGILFSGCSLKTTKESFMPEETPLVSFEPAISRTLSSSDEYLGQNFLDVIDDFKNLGITKIETIKIEDLSFKDLTQDGYVESVSIDDISNFQASEEILPNSKIIITYHTVKTIPMPFSAVDMKSMDYADVKASLEVAGFTSVSAKDVYDIDPDAGGPQFKTEVSINGNSSFAKEDSFPFDAPILITCHKPFEKYTIQVHVDCASNLLFSKYDIDVSFDGNKYAVLQHGTEDTYSFRVTAGDYTISFAKHNSDTICTSMVISNVNSDVDTAYNISCHSDRVDVKEQYIDRKVTLTDNQVKLAKAASDYESKNVWDVLSELQGLGFNNIKTQIIRDAGWLTPEESVKSISIAGQSAFKKYEIFDINSEIIIIYHMKEFSTEEIQAKMAECSGGDAINILSYFGETNYTLIYTVDNKTVDAFNPEQCIFVDGHINSSSKKAYLSFMTAEMQQLLANLEASFPKEYAKRAAVVALTNCQATDVFASDGNTYDISKFHNYSNISGFYISILDEGKYTAVNETTWHVEEMRCILSIYGSYMKVSFDISFDGVNYTMSNLDKTMASRQYIDSTDPSKISVEHLEPTEIHPYLIVPSSLIEKDRNSNLEWDQNNRTLPTPERVNWVGSQFSGWDGSHNELESLIKKNLNNPKSYKHIETTYVEILTEEKKTEINTLLKQGGYSTRAEVGDIFIVTTFSCKNGYNATVKATAIGISSWGNNTITLIDLE